MAGTQQSIRPGAAEPAGPAGRGTAPVAHASAFAGALYASAKMRHRNG